MQRKRKLTASFLEIPEEKDTLKRSWRTGEHSDWTLTLGDAEFKVHKVIVATGERASAFLAAAFRKHLGDADEHTNLTELLPRQCWNHFEAVLDFIYSEKLDIQAHSWGPLVKMADVLQMGTLYTKCIEAGNTFLSNEEAEKHAPRLAIDAVELQLGGRLQEEVIQIAVDLMATCFKGLKTKDLVMQPVEVLQSLLLRDDLEIDNEDAVFDLLKELSKTLSKAQMEMLWRCCRLQRLSPSRVLEVALIQEVPKEAVVWALANQGPPPRPSPPGWASPWAANTRPRGREIVFVIPNAKSYAPKSSVRSESHRLLDRFNWRLLIFPGGTANPESKSATGTTGAFVELVPDADIDEWTVMGIRYSITLVNWKDERSNVSKEHKFHFSHTKDRVEVDNGWHRGFLTAENMTVEQGWLNERGELRFRAQLCCRQAEVRIAHEWDRSTSDGSSHQPQAKARDAHVAREGRHRM
mmetsp:Transcript_40180/g.92966  ORF Transcript_40180/g.92966 Transcript_40180/m.92966 type:complete len:467 (+) Transcript_40180:48-1448(+)